MLGALRMAHKNAINHPGDLRLAALFGVQLETCFKVILILIRKRKRGKEKKGKEERHGESNIVVILLLLICFNYPFRWACGP